MTLPSQTQTPAHEGRRWRWGWVVLLVFVAGIAALGWNIFTWQRAVRQLREAGITTDEYDADKRPPLWKIALQDWRKLFQADTWEIQPTKWAIDRHAADQLLDLDAIASALRRIKPEDLNLRFCTSLQNLDGLKGLTLLQHLHLSNCTSLQNVDGLKGLTSLQGLGLYDCTSLQNVDGLKGLTSLQELGLSDCTSLQNVDGLKGLTSLQELNLRGCTKLPPEEVAALKAALPNTKIRSP